MDVASKILAFSLLCHPIPAECDMSVHATPAIMKTIQDVAVDLEIMDPREERYVMLNKDDFNADLRILQNRFQEFKDAPKLNDHQRFGVRREDVNNMINFNRAFLKNIEEEMVWNQDRMDIYQAVIQETNQLYRVWDALRDVKCDFYYITVRRNALVKLRKLIGEEDYMMGNLPPNVPIWRFREK